MALLQVSLTITADGQQTSITVSNDDLQDHQGLLQDLQAVLKKHIPGKANMLELRSQGSLSDATDCSVEPPRVEESMPCPTFNIPQPPCNGKAARRTKRIVANSLQEVMGPVKLEKPVRRTTRITSFEDAVWLDDLQNRGPSFSLQSNEISSDTDEAPQSYSLRAIQLPALLKASGLK